MQVPTNRKEIVQLTLYLPRDMVRVIDRLSKEKVMSRSNILTWIVRRGLMQINRERGRE